MTPEGPYVNPHFCVDVKKILHMHHPTFRGCRSTSFVVARQALKKLGLACRQCLCATQDPLATLPKLLHPIQEWSNLSMVSSHSYQNPAEGQITAVGLPDDNQLQTLHQALQKNGQTGLRHELLRQVCQLPHPCKCHKAFLCSS